MSDKPKIEKIEDEPGAQGRFLSGVRKALETPHKPHKQSVKVSKPERGKDAKR